MSQASPPGQRIDVIKLQRNLFVLLGFLGSVGLAAFTLKSGNMMMMAGFLVLPFALMLMNRPDLAFLMGVIADASEITVGGINYLTLGVLTQVLVIGSVLLARALRGWQRGARFPEDRPLKFFVAVVLILVIFRGTGLRVLGSATWGGMIYIRILVSISFYLAIRRVQLSTKQIRWVIFGSLVAGLIGTLVQRSGHMAIVSGFTSLEQSVGQTRLMWLLPLVYAAFPIALAIKWRIKIFGWLAWLALVGAIGLTGFRSRFVGLLMITFIYGLIHAKIRLKYLILAGMASLLLWGGAVVVSPVLPKGIQRAVSFIPGTRVDTKIKMDAEGSVDWRVEIWEYCLGESRPYLLLGRGSAFDVTETAANVSTGDIQTYTPWFAFLTRSYHSGPLTLLIDYGLPGLVFGAWLFIAIFARLWKVAFRLRPIDTLEARYSLVLIAWLCWELPAFFLVYGDMPKFGVLLVRAAVVTVLSSSVLKKARQEEEQRRLEEKAALDPEPVA